MNVNSHISLKASERLAATNTSSAIDLSSYTGECFITLNSSATEAADNTADVKITHCDTSGGSYVDSDVSFTQVTNAAASFQVKQVSVDQFKKYVKVVSTIAGTTPKVTLGVTLVGKLA